MDRKTFRGVYDNGDLCFAEPVDMTGCWKIEITFVEREDVENIPFVANPHDPELGPAAVRLEEFHNKTMGQFPPKRPF